MSKQEKQQPKLDYQLHQAQQLEVMNQSLELLKNNVYGQTQVDIVLYALSLGKTEDQAVEYSLALIDKINEVNVERMQKRRAEIEAKMQANNPQVPPVDAAPAA